MTSAWFHHVWLWQSSLFRQSSCFFDPLTDPDPGVLGALSRARCQGSIKSETHQSRLLKHIQWLPCNTQYTFMRSAKGLMHRKAAECLADDVLRTYHSSSLLWLIACSMLILSVIKPHAVVMMMPIEGHRRAPPASFILLCPCTTKGTDLENTSQ